ncbi:hypothetical protein ASD89_24080 [Caulobacter sp. Root656]|nr:hypothetical protein ASD89_24080 [Caulobacter sp. Root656]
MIDQPLEGGKAELVTPKVRASRSALGTGPTRHLPTFRADHGFITRHGADAAVAANIAEIDALLVNVCGLVGIKEKLQARLENRHRLVHRRAAVEARSAGADWASELINEHGV